MFGRRTTNGHTNGNGAQAEASLGNCDKHPFDPAVGACRTCGLPFCETCVVYPFGPAKPPYCVACALRAGGVRRASRVR